MTLVGVLRWNSFARDVSAGGNPQRPNSDCIPSFLFEFVADPIGDLLVGAAVLLRIDLASTKLALNRVQTYDREISNRRRVLAQGNRTHPYQVYLQWEHWQCCLRCLAYWRRLQRSS